VKHGAGQLHINANASDTALLSGVFGGGLDTHLTQIDQAVEAGLSLPEKQGFMSMRFPWAWGPANSLDWTFGLNRLIPIALSIVTSGGQANLELSHLHVTQLDLKTSAGSVSISLPAQAGQTLVRVEASAASLLLRVPPNVAARIVANKALASAEIDLKRFPAAPGGHEHRSADYDTAANRVDIQLDVTLGSVEIV
jgi:hypothetical protein